MPLIVPTTRLVAGSMMLTSSPALLVWMIRIVPAARGTASSATAHRREIAGNVMVALLCCEAVYHITAVGLSVAELLLPGFCFDEHGLAALFSDGQIALHSLFADDVWIRIAGLALFQCGYFSERSVESRMIRNDHVRPRTHRDIAETLRGLDVGFEHRNRRRGAERCSTPFGCKMRAAVVLHGNQRRDGAGGVARRDVERQCRVTEFELLAVGGNHVPLWHGIARVALHQVPIGRPHNQVRMKFVLQHFGGGVMIAVAV